MKLAEKREQMLEVVERWQQSGQSQKMFAEENQIALARLRYWIHQKREKQTGSFVELSTPIVSELIIRYPNGVELQVPPQTPVAQLRHLIFL